jgi:hypothetical protein
MIRLRCLYSWGSLGNSWSLSARLRLIAAGAFFHFFATIAFVVMAAPGSTSRRTILYVCAAGLAVDALRHRASPECRAIPAQVWRNVIDGPVNETEFAKRFRFWKRALGGIQGIWIGCAVILSVATNLPRNLPIAGFSGPLQSINSALLSIDRRAMEQLRLHGFEAREEVISWFFSMNLIFFAVFFAVTFSGMAYGYSQWSLRTAYQRRMSLDGSRVYKLIRGTVVCLAIAVLSHTLFSNFFWLKWEGYGHSFWWDLQSSDLPMICFSLVESFVSFCLFLAYFATVLARWVVHRPPSSTYA